MDNLWEKIELLTKRVNELAAQQTKVSKQLLSLLDELETLKKQAQLQIEKNEDPKPVVERVIDTKIVINAPGYKEPQHAVAKKADPSTPSLKTSRSFEEFIGKNVASKVGILVTIIGI